MRRDKLDKNEKKKQAKRCPRKKRKQPENYTFKGKEEEAVKERGS